VRHFRAGRKSRQSLKRAHSCPEVTSHDLPGGRFTKLVLAGATDIEGSTQLLHHLGRDGYAEMLAEHERLLRAAFAAHGGRVVDTHQPRLLLGPDGLPGL
jgi:class 3 adenylate cyclase